MAVRIGNHLTHSGLCLPSRLDVGAILFHIIFQRNEHVKVGGNVIILQSIVSEEYVGQITAGQQERLVLRLGGIACVLPVALDDWGLFHLPPLVCSLLLELLLPPPPQPASMEVTRAKQIRLFPSFVHFSFMFASPHYRIFYLTVKSSGYIPKVTSQSNLGRKLTP